ncbi:MAG: hypothetical protein K2L67_00830 [Clostridia bacterium]|nr:hypothetical protein [Clostridia bacterium]
MEAAVVKIDYELIDEIIRESFVEGLMPETDRALYYKINLHDGNAGLHAFGASVYAEDIKATEDFYDKCKDAESAKKLIKKVYRYEDFAFVRADRWSMLRLIGKHIKSAEITGMPEKKRIAAIDFFGETEEDLRCTAVVVCEDAEDFDFDLREADGISGFSDGGFNGFDKVTKLK